MEEKLPSLSIIMVTLNCESIIERCLRCIEQQIYPKELIEVLIIDGGSTDKTLDIARAHGVKIINAGYPENQEARRAVGLLSARNEILTYIDSDNFLPSDKWLLEMVEPFCEDEKIIATQTLRYAYIPGDTLMNRYSALFGGKDPIPFYLKKQDRLPWTENSWNLLGKVIKETKNYYTVEFDSKIPTLGCNGFLIKRDILLKSNHDPAVFFHTDVLQDLINKGYKRYGIVKNSIIHSINGGFLTNLKKRYSYMLTYTQTMSHRRRYMIYDVKSFSDNMRLLKYILYTVTVIKPLYDSLKGYLYIRDFAWFLHLPMCWCTLFTYTFAVTKLVFNRKFAYSKVASKSKEEKTCKL